MDVVHVDGKKNGNIMLYALSTCVWCKMTKKLLGDLGVDFSYVFVDLPPGRRPGCGNGRSKALEPIRLVPYASDQ